MSNSTLESWKIILFFRKKAEKIESRNSGNLKNLVIDMMYFLWSGFLVQYGKDSVWFRVGLKFAIYPYFALSTEIYGQW